MEKNLKSIELQGYKTFASKTVFEFDSAITAIVGPNGSGKSNIADAVRWVLGEQSYSLLRGRKTADMIFSGSEERSRAGMASATILFNNETGWLPIDFSEVSIARRAYRDGTNEYLINGQRVRLRDVTELLASSGLSERTYTIIGQGLVDVALSLKAEERRRLFEEAAGIGLYRSRREEAQKRLEATKRNLERVEDILSELKPRLRSLEKQAERTRQHEQITSDLHVILREWYGYHWFRAQRELQKAQIDHKKSTTELDNARTLHDEIDQNIVIIQEQIKEFRSQLQTWNQQSVENNRQREIISRDLAVTEERINALRKSKSDVEEELERSNEQLSLQKEKLAEAIRDYEHYERELTKAELSAGDTKEELESHQIERGALEPELKGLQARLIHLEERQNHLRGLLDKSKNQIDFHRSSQASNDDAFESAQKAYLDLLENTELLKQHSVDKNLARQSAEERYKIHQEQIDHLRKEREDKTNSLAARENEIVRLKAELEIHIRAEDNHLDYKFGAQVILDAELQGELHGNSKVLSNRIEVSEKLQAAIYAALDDFFDAVILNDGALTSRYLDRLSEQGANAIIVPLDALQYESIRELSFDEYNGIIGVATDFVTSTPDLQPVIDLLLGQVILVEDRGAAVRVLEDETLQRYKLLRAVTLKGEVYHLSGPIITNYDFNSQSTDQKYLREVEDRISKLGEDAKDLEEILKDITDRLESVNKEKDEHIRTIEAARQDEAEAGERYSHAVLERDQAEQQMIWYRQQQERLEEQIDQEERNATHLSQNLNRLDSEIHVIQEQIRDLEGRIDQLNIDEKSSEANYWNTQTAVIEQALESSRRYKLERREALEMLSLRKTRFEEQLSDISASLLDQEKTRDELRSSEAEVVERLDLLNETIKPNKKALDEAENQLIDLQSQEVKARKQLNDAERMYSQAQIILARRQEELKTLRERIENDFGLVDFEYAEDISGPAPLPWEGLVEHLPFVNQLPQGSDDTIKRLRGQLRRIGAVNPEAQHEYQEVKDRYEFITGQIVDLSEAEKDVQAVIRELDVMMEREFCLTFEKVSKEFSEIFMRLFGGGSAQIVLTDPDDVMTTGIDIEVRLPGRRTHGLSLLSGGERSLTATALIFSLLRISPTPFCILDEVDAMLDEANIGRFREILQELSENSQFIIITHNRSTVQAANIIYGVTMGRDSTSQMVSLKMDQVKEIV